MRVSRLRAVVGLLSCATLARAQGEPERRGARVFDARAAGHYTEFGLSRLSVRATDRAQQRGGWELSIADELRWTPSPALIAGWFGASLRVLPDGVAGSIGQSGGLAGLWLGPVELKAGVGLSLLNLLLHDGRADAGLFWPRTLAGVGLSLGPVRIDALAHLEYLWCWFGPDQIARGLGLALSVQRPQIGPAPSQTEGL